AQRTQRHRERGDSNHRDRDAARGPRGHEHGLDQPAARRLRCEHVSPHHGRRQHRPHHRRPQGCGLQGRPRRHDRRPRPDLGRPDERLHRRADRPPDGRVPRGEEAHRREVREVRPRAHAVELQAGPLSGGHGADPEPARHRAGGPGGVGGHALRDASRGARGDEADVRGDAGAPHTGAQRRLHRLEDAPLRGHRGVRARGEGPGFSGRLGPDRRPAGRAGPGAAAHHDPGGHRGGGAREDPARGEGDTRPPGRVLLRGGRGDPGELRRAPARRTGRHGRPRRELHGRPDLKAPLRRRRLLRLLRGGLRHLLERLQGAPAGRPAGDARRARRRLRARRPSHGRGRPQDLWRGLRPLRHRRRRARRRHGREACRARLRRGGRRGGRRGREARPDGMGTLAKLYPGAERQPGPRPAAAPDRGPGRVSL
ncbi:MAG: ADP-ribose pyrophosphatase of COG1058 family / Nicotinamide-nucleotide amidase, partial [uncultured Rubrobacteraceae bacterium]